MSRTVQIVCALATLLLASLGATAEQDENAAVVAAAAGVPTAAGMRQAGWRSQWGLGTIVNPETVGRDDYNTQPIPYFDFRYMDGKGTKYFANVPQGLGGFFYRNRSAESDRFFNVGAAVAPGFNQREDIDGLDDVDISVEARLYVEAGSRRWVASATLAQDLGSGHEGAYLDLSLNRRGQLGSRSGFYAVGPVVRIGDDSYQDAFFSVNARESLASGLNEYDADTGVERVGLQGLASLPLGQSKWRVTTLLRVSQLIGDAADSPIVDEETQFFFLTAFTRPF